MKAPIHSKPTRWLLTTLVALAAVALVAAGCGSDDDDDAAADAIKVGLVFDLGGRGDMAFNDAAAAGLDRAVADFGIDSADVSPNDEGTNLAELLSGQAQDSELVIGVGFLFADDMKPVAAANPETCFGIIDGEVVEPTDNVVMLHFAEADGSFLVGAAAALKSNADHIGFIGGVRIPLIERFEAGFAAGARHINPDIEIAIDYISEPPDFTGFVDPASARIIGGRMYEQGADVIFNGAGGSGAGLFEAAKERSDTSGSKVWAIGVDSDQYTNADVAVREFILTSMLKGVDVAVYELIKERNAGTCDGGIKVFDLASDGVGYATSGGFVDDIAPQLDDLKQQIIDGAIVVPDTVVR